VLVGQAVITVSGKLAQFGSRLLVPVSDAMLQQFAGNFRTAAAAVAVAPPAAAGAPPTASAPPAPAPAPEVKALNPFALLWIMVKSWFAGLFGKKA
jgi:hypothetical protein